MGAGRSRRRSITHVDESARCQTAGRSDNVRLHELLSEVTARSALGVLRNTSLNFRGLGFISRLSDLTRYCEDRGVDDMAVEDVWFGAPGGVVDREAFKPG